MPSSDSPSSDRRSSKDRVLDVAQQVLYADGMRGFTVRRVAAAAGSHHASLHYAFGTREALLGELLMRQFTPARALIGLRLEGTSLQDRVVVREALSAITSPLRGVDEHSRDGLLVLFRDAGPGAAGAYATVRSILLGTATDRLEYCLAIAMPGLARRQARAAAHLAEGFVILWMIKMLDNGEHPATEESVLTMLTAAISSLTGRAFDHQ